MKIRIYGKTADGFSLNTSEGQEYNGYPPIRRSISKDGDSIEVEIDNDTGMIIGWKPWTKEDIERLQSQCLE